MGLDYLITLKAKNKNSTDVHELELCYWRKYWSLRDELQYLVRSEMNKEYKIYDDFPDDCVTSCTTDILKPLIELLLDLEKDSENQVWHNCIFSSISARVNTLSQINELILVDYFFDSFKEDSCVDVERLSESLCDYPFLEDFLNNKRDFNNYDFSIEFINSY